MTLLMTFF